MSKSTSSIKFQILGIGEILRKGGLAVPTYQRPYAWTEKNVEELLTDLGSAISEGPKTEYFLGSVVILGEDPAFEVVDGQQRLATTLIFIAAIRDYFIEHSDSTRAAKITNDYLLSEDLRSQETEPKLKLGAIDHDYFLNQILKYDTQTNRRRVVATRESHKKLRKAAQVARGHVLALGKTTSDPTNALIDRIDFIQSRAQVIRVGVPDTANAFTIFETLNDRGLELAISDLLKNFIFKLAEDRIEECSAAWAQMTGSLAAVDAEGKIVEFIRHAWSSRHGLTRERVLFENIKRTIKSKQGSVDLSLGFAEGAVHYAGILTASSEYWSKYGEATRGHMETLNLLRMTQVRPLLLAILSNFTTRDVSKSLKAMVSWAVRFFILGKLGSGALENFYAEQARRISGKEISDYEALREHALKEVPTDTQFKEAFATATVGRGHLARYYLRALENQASGKGSPELTPNLDPNAVNLEHILPQSPDQSWNVSEEIVETHVNRIGNLVLLSAKDNASIGNDSFDTKKNVFRKSRLVLTQSIAEEASWGKEQIETRQSKLADLAIKTWSLD